MTPQPCVSCGRSTAVGTPFFASRRVIPPAADDTAAESSYLCEECADQIHIAARESDLALQLVQVGPDGLGPLLLLGKQRPHSHDRGARIVRRQRDPRLGWRGQEQVRDEDFETPHKISFPQ